MKNLIKENIDEIVAYHSSDANFNYFSLDDKYVGQHGQIYGYGVYLDLEEQKAYARYGKNLYTVEIPDDPQLYLYGQEKVNFEIINDIINELYYVMTNENFENYYNNDVEQEILYNRLQNLHDMPDGLELYYAISNFLQNDKKASEFFLNNTNFIGMIYNISKEDEPEHLNVIIFDPYYIEIINKEINN